MQKFKAIPTHKLRDTVCQRCNMMQVHHKALDACVPAEEYEAVIRHIANQVLGWNSKMLL